jgi:hypothetical protein
MSVIFVNGWTTKNTLEMWIGTWITRWNDHGTTRTRTHPTRLVTFLGGTSPRGAPFHSTLSHNGSHNNSMACEREAHHDTSSLLYRCCWQHWKFQWFLSPSSNLNFFGIIWKWDVYYICSFNFYNTNKMVHTFVISTLYPLGVWASCKGLLNTPP